MKLAIEPTPDVPAPVPAAPSRPSLAPWILAALILAAGILVRVWPSAGFTGTGFDEALYRDNVIKLDVVGLFNYPAI